MIDINPAKLSPCDPKLCDSCWEAALSLSAGDEVIKVIWKRNFKKGSGGFLRRKCKPPTVTCTECKPPNISRGVYRKKTNEIVICANNIHDYRTAGKNPCLSLWETMRHELAHAANACEGITNLPPCEACLYDELTAHYAAGQCKPGATWWIDHAPITPAIFVNERECLINSISQHSGCVANECSDAGANIATTAADLVDKFLNSLSMD